MSTVPERPRLRPVEVLPVDAEGDAAYALRDPLDVAPHPIVLSAGALLVLQQLDGNTTSREAQANIFREVGHLFELEQIEQLLETLDDAFFLDSPRFRVKYDSLVEEFRALPTRPAVLAGQGYPTDPDELRSFLDDLLTGVDGETPVESGALRAVVAPHIDLSRGGQGFAAAYREIAANCDADLYIVLGIAHQGGEEPFFLTDKDFETPLGTMPTDREFVARLRERCPADALGDELAHRNEHSIEFQAVMLRHAFPDRDISMVPILCGSLHDALVHSREPSRDDVVRGFIDGLRATIEETGTRACIVASVDLSHVGRRFGDSEGIDDERLQRIDHADHELLDAVAKRDVEEYFRLLARDENARHVCGYPALYTMLNVMPETGPGRLLDYRQSVEEDTDSVVSFAAMAFDAAR